MRFILFNIVVAAGLVFLLTRTGDLVAPAGRDTFSDVVLKATEIGDQVAEKLARARRSTASDETGAPVMNADRDPPAAPGTPKAVEATEPSPSPPTGPRAVAGSQAAEESVTDAEPAALPPPLPAAIEVPPRTVAAVPADDLDAEVRKRRAEVLGEGSAKARFTVEEGSELMTPAERRRELDALVEEMELLYIGQIGG